MPYMKLFVAPNTCARVATIALEEIGVPFETSLVRTAANQQNSPEFLELNPKGKVPTLLIDGAPLTENVAILTWLASEYPDAGLMPATTDRLDQLKQIADLAFFAGTVHPVVTRIAMPQKLIADAAQSYEIVRPAGAKDMNKIMSMIDARLADGPWWYGAVWSIVDAYLYWVWARITSVGYDGASFANVQRHFAMNNDRPAVQRAMAREDANIETLKSENLYMVPR